MKYVSKLLSTLLYAGYFPVAPGTVGTFIAFVAYVIIPRSFIELPCFWVFPVLLIIPSVLLTGIAEKQMQRDDKRIILDEFIGFFFAIIFLPKLLSIGVAAFILFRFFDILKPPPIDNIQRFKEGWGIVLDDVMAGIYSNLVIQIGYFLFLLTR